MIGTSRKWICNELNEWFFTGMDNLSRQVRQLSVTLGWRGPGESTQDLSGVLSEIPVRYFHLCQWLRNDWGATTVPSWPSTHNSIFCQSDTMMCKLKVFTYSWPWGLRSIRSLWPRWISSPPVAGPHSGFSVACIPWPRSFLPSH